MNVQQLITVMKMPRVQTPSDPTRVNVQQGIMATVTIALVSL